MSKPSTPDPERSTTRTAAPASQRFSPLAYRVSDAGAATGISGTTVWRLIREGRLPARHLDGPTIIRHEDLVAFIDALPLVWQLAEIPEAPLPEPPPPVPRPVTAPPPPARVKQPPPSANLRRAPVPPKFALSQPPPAPARPDKQALYGRGRTGKPLPPPDPNGWGVRTLRRPSEQLASIIVGPDPISRPKALEKVWKHIHTGGLQREGDMRIIYADEKLRAVAGTDVIAMYVLEALIRPHLGVIT